jgi:predicted dienelactone hydrolase
LIACVLSLATATLVHADTNVGLAALTLVDPVEGGPMPAWVAYPSAGAAGTTEVGPYEIDGVRDAPTAAGRYPLIVFSHGTGGSRFDHHDSMTALARGGFIAAAIDHPRNNRTDNSGVGTDLQYFGRPHHIVALIDALLASTRFAPLIDPARIGMVGFSAGGTTTIIIVGARPNIALRDDYCRAGPDDARACGPHPPGWTFRRRPELNPVADPRVRAAFVMAPGPGLVFDREGLAGVHVPIRLYRAGADEVLPHPWHAERVRQLLPVPPEYVVIAGADHYVFLAPCSAAFAAAIPEICRDPPGIDRTAIHRQLNAEMLDFFGRTLRAE